MSIARTGPVVPVDDGLLAWLGEAAATARSSGLSGLYPVIESALAELVGFKLLTVLQVEQGRLIRRHSSDLQHYPAGGHKMIAGDAWLERLLEQGVPMITDGTEQVRERFFDHQAIFGIGCQSVLNVPVHAASQSLGSINLLHEQGHFTGRHAQLVLPFVHLLGLAWLARA